MKTSPVEVKHTIVLDTEKLEAFYRADCATRYSNETDIETCTNQQMADFLNNFTSLK